MSDGLDPLEKMDVIDQVVEKYRIDIQKKFQDAETLLSSSDVDGQSIKLRK